ncbi:MAG: flagellar biosynthesis regulator FlhF [Hydrogenophilales bacterium 28-61-23]|nr:MAG: flagellar biosynthesis regulator FlhF [Hydrogenophilales bacterium 28-61-23]
MPANPLDAYRNVEKATLSQRDIEATVLTKAAVQLQSIKENWARDNHDAELEDALSYNQRVWTFFQAEISMQDNPLPDEIKRNILALSFFVDRRTFETLAYPAPEKLDALININLNVAAGLRGEV